MIRNLLLITASAFVLTACGGGASTNEAAKGNTTAAAPAESKWVETASETPEGGMVMGNPDAKVKLIEYGALSCPVCAAFSNDSHSELTALVAKGTVSFEFRPFLVHGISDVPPTVLSRCNGPAAFFTIMEKLYADQPNWLAKMQQMPREKQAALENAKPMQVSAALAEAGELVPFVQQLGVSTDKAKACLADEKEIQKLVDISNKGTKDLKVAGTPTFFINGQKVENTVSWADLKPKLTDAGA
jgi:protein-disulfide isomerase